MLHLGNNIEILKSFKSDSVDSVVTDPPYGLSFMNKHWDYDVPSVELWREVLRVLKPGGHLLSFGGTRTYHRMVVNIEDAGFEIRDQLQWIYGSGFPKSLDVSKAIDKAAGAEREVVGVGRSGSSSRAFQSLDNTTAGSYLIDVPTTNLAKQWQGWGTALKPANEPIVLARKPISMTVAKNVEKYGTGALNIDASRIETTDNLNGGAYSDNREISTNEVYGEYKRMKPKDYKQPQGRWPSNVLFDEEAAKMLDEQQEQVSRFFYCAKASRSERNAGLDSARLITISLTCGQKTTEYEDLKVRLLMDTEHSGIKVIDEYIAENKKGFAWNTSLFGKQLTDLFQKDATFTTKTEIQSTIKSKTLSALASSLISEFTLDAKLLTALSTSHAENVESSNQFQIIIDERTALALGASHAVSKMPWTISVKEESFKSCHPTVKPIKLMQYLVKLITPPNGTVLDPFMGSGTTGCAAVSLGFNFEGIEIDKEYFEIAMKRIENFIS